MKNENLKPKTHRLWPVSFTMDGVQYDTVWTTRPIGEQYWIGTPIDLVTNHPVGLQADLTAKEIADLELRLAQLRGQK